MCNFSIRESNASFHMRTKYVESLFSQSSCVQPQSTIEFIMPFSAI